MQDWGNKENDGVRAESIADYLLKNGVVVLPCEKVYYIVDKNTKYATIYPKNIKELSIKLGVSSKKQLLNYAAIYAGKK